MGGRRIGQRTSRRLRALSIGCSAGVVALVTMGSAPVPEDDFRDALASAGAYHRELSNLPGKYPDQPETAVYEFERLTVETLEAQYGVTVGPCFARWWAYELTGLELTALSLELRRTHKGYDETADNLERLATRMWANAMALLPTAASDCGIDRRPLGSIGPS